MGDPERALRYTSCKDRPALPAAELSPIWAEGPYGNLTHFDYFPTVLLVAGGTGVSFCLPIMMDIIRRARSMRLGGSEAVATERLTFVWIVKEKGTFHCSKRALRSGADRFTMIQKTLNGSGMRLDKRLLSHRRPFFDSTFTSPRNHFNLRRCLWPFRRPSTTQHSLYLNFCHLRSNLNPPSVDWSNQLCLSRTVLWQRFPAQLPMLSPPYLHLRTHRRLHYSQGVSLESRSIRWTKTR